ncbi:unnamed protein product [Tilletia controversa]|nr:unnamed protein product [Tilletia controversa]
MSHGGVKSPPLTSQPVASHAPEDVEARTRKVNRWRERIPTTFDADELTMRLEYLQLDQDIRDVKHRLEKLVAITHQPASAPNATSAPVAENERPVPTPAPVALSTSAGTIKRSSQIPRARSAVARSGKNGKTEIHSGTETTITGQKRSATSKTKAGPTQPVVDGVLLPPQEVLLIAPTKKGATKADREQPANHDLTQPRAVLPVVAGPPDKARKARALRGDNIQRTGTALAQDGARPPVPELKHAAEPVLGPSSPMPAPKSSLAPIQVVPSEKSHIHSGSVDAEVQHSAALSSQDNRAKAGIHLGSFKPNDLFANPRLEPSSFERTQERINKTETQSLPAPTHSPPHLEIEAYGSSAAAACRAANASRQVEESADRRISASTKTSVLASNLKSHRASAPSDSASTAPPAQRSSLGLCPSSLKVNDFFANGSSRPSLITVARTGKMASQRLPAPIQEASQPQLDNDMVSSADDVPCRIPTVARQVDKSTGERKPASAKNPPFAPNLGSTFASAYGGSALAASSAPRSSLPYATVAQDDKPSTDVGFQMVNIGKERASSPEPSLSYAQVANHPVSCVHRPAEGTGERKDNTASPYQPYSDQKALHSQPEQVTVVSRREQPASETGPGPRTTRSSEWTSVQTYGFQAEIDIDTMNPRIVRSSDSGDVSGPGTMRFYHRGEPGYYMTNFFHSPMFLDGQMYATSEAYFQSRKFPHDRWLCQRIASARSPRVALDLATENKRILRDDWFQVNVQAMFDAVMLKFICNSTLATQLLNTGDAYLIEAAPKDVSSASVP